MKKVLIIVAMTLFCFGPSLYAATLQWEASRQAATYKVFIREDGTQEWQGLGDAVTGTQIELPDMKKYDQDYELGVKAYNKFGNVSDMSDTVKYNQLQADPVEAPGNLRIIIDVNLNVSVKK